MYKLLIMYNVLQVYRISCLHDICYSITPGKISWMLRNTKSFIQEFLIFVKFKKPANFFWLLF